jgi:hypothetical protein
LPGLPEKLNYDLDICLCEDREAGTRLTPETREEGGGEGSQKEEYRKDVEEFSKGKRRMKEISD